ncbi:F-box/LRR-repeat protein 6 isoform X2 [Protopterus annectens]|uniref:F-box/LRR-repeat protein 6 isoform X2 n=1 Tax=Protopterus annectens TaxID=7888 RepID=UPI001CF98B52|nr:F-box/LRR-repeat protein 6 isoform X2 [Protopterus annectens]
MRTLILCQVLQDMEEDLALYFTGEMNDSFPSNAEEMNKSSVGNADRMNESLPGSTDGKNYFSVGLSEVMKGESSCDPGPTQQPVAGNKTSRKRKLNIERAKNRSRSPLKMKHKRKKKRKIAKKAVPEYFVQNTDRDMLLVISNLQDSESERTSKLFAKRKKSARKRKGKTSIQKSRTVIKTNRKAKKVKDTQPRDDALGPLEGQVATVPQGSPVHQSEIGPNCWGTDIPVEILVRIFHFVTVSEGAVPFLCRVSCVCQLWCGAAANPRLWNRVTIGHCWIQPGQKKQQPSTERRIRNTIEWLTLNRFSQLREFSLCHWQNQVEYAIKTVSESCPHLTYVKLYHCGGVTADALQSLAIHCPKLESLNLQSSQVDAAIIVFLQAAGFRLRQLWLTYNNKLNAVFSMLSSGCCPELQLLEVNTDIRKTKHEFQISVEALQVGCPKLQVLRLLNLIWIPKSSTKIESAGFPELEELCLATSSFSFVSNSTLFKILHSSYKLRVLDLRGCYKVSPQGLLDLPCMDIECLYLGLYCSSNNLLLAKEGSTDIARRWHHCLREVDFTGLGFTEKDLKEAINILVGSSGNKVLRSLNFTSSQVCLEDVSKLIAGCPNLQHLDVTSCRNLPRGLKRDYRGRHEIQQLWDKLQT